MTKFFGLGFERALDRLGAVFLTAPAVLLGGALASMNLPL